MELTKEYIFNRIKELGYWYQTIDIDGVKTTTLTSSDDKVWEKIKTFLPHSLVGKRVLDLGCNAGLYSVKCAEMGAEVVGIEAAPKHYNQALFVKDCFENLLDKKLNITYSLSDISKVNFRKLGKFDYVLAIAILYHIGVYKFQKPSESSYIEQQRIIGELSRITNRVISRFKSTNPRFTKEYFDPIFKRVGFLPKSVISEGKRQLVLYENLDIRKIIEDEVKEIRTIKSTGEKRIFQVTLAGGSIRLDVAPIEYADWYTEISRLQKEAYRNGILVAKVIKEGTKEDFFYKLSEWIEGASVIKFLNLPSIFAECGKLLGKTNMVKIDNGFLTNSDFYGRNILLSKDQKVYMIDVDALKVRSEDDLDLTVVKSILRWTGIGKDNIMRFLDGYSVYRDPTEILKKISERNWVWRN
jgi:SAM-dependent methyltransferase